MSKIKIIIADDIEETRNVIKKILTLENDFFEIVGEAGNGEEVLKLIPKVKPDIVLMDINMPVLNGLEATEQITNQFPAVTVIIMSVQAESEYLKKAMFHGAKEYIIKPFNYEGVVNTILTTYEKYKNKAINAANFEEGHSTAKIITYFSSKGGVGKSILALNSAVTLSREYHKKTLLIDLDLQFGDISMLVNKYSEKTILDVIEDGQLDSYEKIKPYLHEFNENLHILFAPTKPEAAEYIGKDSIEKMIKTLKKQYDVIIIDTGINFNDSTLYILDLSEIVLFVATMEIVALKNTKLGLGVMKSLGYDKNKVKLIINNFTTKYGISKAEVEGVFMDGIFAMIPEEQSTVSTSVNKGKPFCDSPKYDKLKIGKAISIMCKDLAM
ncbi:response regulator [Clostridium sp.]|uniref:response regulator n=1 Tax=Clostridium sp. TaxID=1506 RepID=UPI001A5F1E72|nr:response regulator [Clostridium sp.]MBK5241511.1 response regulator [Clostridium sp.]